MRKFEVYNRKNRLEVKMTEYQCDWRNRMSDIVRSVDNDVDIEISVQCVHALGLCALVWDLHTGLRFLFHCVAWEQHHRLVG